MPNVPEEIPIFHITSFENLDSICEVNALLSKNQQKLYPNLKVKDISYADIQEYRAFKGVIDPPGGVIHDYVPFYFAPRAPMLYGLKARGIPQERIIHLFTTVNTITTNNISFAFFNMHMMLDVACSFNSLADLNQIAWDLFFDEPCLPNVGYTGHIQIPKYSKFWKDNSTNLRYINRKASRQAEFLVKNKLSLSLLMGIGVMNEKIKLEVSRILALHKVSIPVYVIPSWYYTS